MVAIIMHRRRNLVVPKSTVKGEKVLKSCVRCRQNKTRCDALKTSPLPCSYCSKKNIACQLDTSKPSNREYELTEKIVSEVRDLHDKVDGFISRKSQLIQKLLDKNAVPSSTAFERVLSVPQSPETSIYIDPIPTLSLRDSFSIHTNSTLDPVSITLARATHLVKAFQKDFSAYLPILPDSFFDKPLHTIHQENDLLFWSMIVTSLIQEGSADEYSLLAGHVQNLVVVNCWFNTPRSLYSLIALLILTTWPLPEKSSQIQDNACVKYISLMKSLSLQFGLHKLNFIDEFSKKTEMQLDGKPEINHAYRERIYKYVNINSNYWLVLLGLSTSNYNGFHQDFIIDKSANFDIFKQSQFAPEDNFINSILKVSLMQSKMNENMNDLIENPSNVGKLINLNMFEQILDSHISSSSPLVSNELTKLSLEYSKIQLYIYYLSDVDIELPEYKSVIYKAVTSCKNVLDLFEKRFPMKNYFSIPIHYRFSIELVSLMLLRIHSSPLLYSVKHYQEVKSLFLRSYAIITNKNNPEWCHLNKKLLNIIHKFDSHNKMKSFANKSKAGSFFLVDKMSSHLVSSLHYEMVWDIYRGEKTDEIPDVDDIDWKVYNLSREEEEQSKVIDYLTSCKSIFE